MARFDFAARTDLTSAFPFPHELTIEAIWRERLSRSRLPSSRRASAEVPISFGYHPYFHLPEVERADWQIEVPVSERLVLDADELPTGRREPAPVSTAGPLGSRTFDDEFVAPPDSAPCARRRVRRIEVALLAGYPYTQVYAPADDDVVAFEPMTAPTDALLVGGWSCRCSRRARASGPRSRSRCRADGRAPTDGDVGARSSVSSSRASPTGVAGVPMTSGGRSIS